MGSTCSCLKVENGHSTASTKDGELYDKYRDTIKSFDIVLFRGGDYVSDFIRFLESRYSPTQTSTQKYKDITADAFSHVGLLLRGDVLEGVENVSKDKIYVWESTMSGLLSEDGLKNVENNSHFGIQLRDFDELVEKYDNKSYKSKQTQSNKFYKKLIMNTIEICWIEFGIHFF